MTAPLIRQLPFDLAALGGSVLASQAWGGETSHKNYSYHSLDFSVPFGTKLYAMAEGVVVDLRESIRDGGARSSASDVGPSNIGNFVTVYYPSLGIYVTYQHLQYNSVSPIKGSAVHTGDLFGSVGNTGLRSGTHLHFQLGLDKITFTNEGDRPNSIVANGTQGLGAPATFDTATGRIEAGIVSQVAYDLSNRALGSDQHNLTLLGSRAINGYGDGYNNIISGTSGFNLLDGKGGNDTIFGGAGNDTIVGGAGADVLSGGPGNDVFVFRSLSDTGNSATTRDVIKDFQLGDRGDLSGIDANTLKNGDQAFTYIGNQGFHRIAGELHLVKGILEGDVNGDGIADFQIELVGVTSVSASAFIL